MKMPGLIKRRTAGVTAIGAMALVLTLSACQSAVDLENQGSGETAEPVQGGTLMMADSADAAPNALQAGRAGNRLWAGNVFETLTQVDADGTPQPLLATGWAVADDGLSMEITLRDDVTFHSGRPMTADDVEYTIGYIASSASQVAYIAKKISAIDVTSGTGLTLSFAEPIPNIYDLFEYMYIVDSETAEVGLADGSAVIGTGPFTFDAWSPGSEISLVRNEDYWGEPAYLDGIDIAIIPDSTAMLNAVRSDRVQVASGMNSQDVQSVGAGGDFDVLNIVGSVYPLGVNIEAAPFDNREVRQAVQIAIDRDRIADQIFGDAATPTNLFWDAASVDYPSELDNAYPYDPDKAAEMIEDAGATGAPVSITVISIPNNTSVAEIVRNNLEEVGLAPTINVVEIGAFGEQQSAGELGAAFLPLHGLNGLSPVTLVDVLPSLREGNPSHFWTDEYAELRTDLATASEEDYPDALEALSAYIIDQAFTANIARVDAQVVTATDLHGLRSSIRGYLDAGAAYISE